VANIICLDFDDTIVLENTARLIFEQYASPAWREFEAQYHTGLLSVEQFNAAALETVEAPKSDLQAFVTGTVTVRPGFLELLDWAQWNDWLPIVVSNGFDFYVDAVLDSLGADRLARHAGRTALDYRWRVTYYSPRGIALEDGFKLSYAAAFQNSGDFVAYIGDGASDLPAAKLAQAVFARSTLLERLDGVHPRVYGFESFNEVVEVLAQESEGWLQEAAVSS
jgi:2,3-diketo-5-methylthio-1-phosphopentane phosphatase